MDDSGHIPGLEDEGSLYTLRTDSMDSDSSIDSENLVSIPVSPSMMPYPEDLTGVSRDDLELNKRINGDDELVDFNKRISRNEDLEKEVDKQIRRRQKKGHKWKGDAQRVASKLTSVFKKTGRHGGHDSPRLIGSSQGEGRPFEFNSLQLDSSDAGSDEEDVLPSSFFDDDGKNLGTSFEEMPRPLPGGVVLDQDYGVSAKAMNAIIFRPGSAFVQELLQIQKTTNYVAEPWKKVGNEPIRRVVTYTQAATKLVKAVKASETQTYIRADDKCYCVRTVCATPDVPCGGNFVIEIQVTIIALPDLPGGEKCCHLEVSWRVNFLHSTLMKGVIEGGARSGIRDNYMLYKEILARHAKPISSGDVTPRSSSTNDDERPIGDWEIAWDYFGKGHVLLALMSLTVILVHIGLAPSKRLRGLEVWGIDFPDTLMEFITSAIVVVQVERVAIMAFEFIRARYWRSGDHGVKAQGDGWLTTVTLIEGENIAPTDSGTSNPYVVFTCNGKTRTSSVKLRTSHPSWREIFEFNATDDPPTRMDVEVFDYDGPFSTAESLGHAEINFLRQSPGDLSDIWLPLNGKSARANGSKVHLRVYLTNTRDADALPEYLERVEREVGLKVSKRSAQRNSSFQKLFSMPAEEFLINDFACAIKRKIPIQGRLFLSPRLLGFYSNLFGHKTKFTLLWEEMEEIKETAQSINPSIVVFLRKGRGFDARHGARGIDGRGRLKFQFLSFVRSGTAFRTIIALWKNRNLSPEQKMDIIASVEAGDMRYSVAERQADDTQPFLGIEEAIMPEVDSLEIPITVESVLAVLNDDRMDKSVNEKLGIVNYNSTPWELVEKKSGVKRRQLSYNLDKKLSQFGSKVSCIQQQTASDDKKKLTIDEILTLHDVPFGDHFQVQVRREHETLSLEPITTHVKLFVGVAWHKSTELDQKKITKNIVDHMTHQSHQLLRFTVQEIHHSSGKDDRRATGV